MGGSPPPHQPLPSTPLTERLALNDGKENDDDEEEESQIKEDAINLVRITVRSADLIACNIIIQILINNYR